MGIRVLPPVVGMKRKPEAEAENGSTHAAPAVFCGFVPFGCTQFGASQNLRPLP